MGVLMRRLIVSGLMRLVTCRKRLKRIGAVVLLLTLMVFGPVVKLRRCKRLSRVLVVPLTPF